MYQVFFDGYPLHDPRSAELQLRDPDVHLSSTATTPMQRN